MIPGKSEAVRVGHLGDLHLGRRWLSVQNGAGVNLREADVYEMADAVAEFLIDVGVDVCVIAGDLYDSVNPTTRARGAGFRLVTDLRSEGIEVVICGGNHDHTASSTPSPLIHLSEFFGAHVALEQTHLDVRGLRLHMLPYQALARLASGGELAAFERADGPNVLVSHAYLSHPDLGSAPERVQLPLAVAEDPAFDLVLLGHIHQHVRLGERIYYSGALERLNLGEVDAPLGVWVHDIAPDGAVITHDTPLERIGEPRPMRIIQVTQDTAGIDALHQAVLARIDEDAAAGSVIQIRIHDADPDLRQSAHPRMWAEHAKHRGALHCEVQLRSRPLEETLNEQIAPLPTRLDEGLRQYLTDHDRPDLIDLALAVLEEAAP